LVEEVDGADLRVHVGPLRERAAIGVAEHPGDVVRLMSLLGHQRGDAVPELVRAAHSTPPRIAAGVNTRRVHARRSYGFPASFGELRSSSAAPRRGLDGLERVEEQGECTLTPDTAITRTGGELRP
jgi:hypothetical protein